jgi:hypothetical protein
MGISFWEGFLPEAAWLLSSSDLLSVKTLAVCLVLLVCATPGRMSGAVASFTTSLFPTLGGSGTGFASLALTYGTSNRLDVTLTYSGLASPATLFQVSAPGALVLPCLSLPGASASSYPCGATLFSTTANSLLAAQQVQVIVSTASYTLTGSGTFSSFQGGGPPPPFPVPEPSTAALCVTGGLFLVTCILRSRSRRERV